MKAIIIDKIQTAIQQLQDQDVWADIQTLPEIVVDYPTLPEHGDYASNIAMRLAKVLKQNPLEIAQTLATAIDQTGLEQIKVAAPGFLNFFVNEKFLAGGVRLILQQQEKFGLNQTGLKPNGQPKKVLVEFLSANPTGPIHLGNGRGGFSGDVLSRVLRASGYEVIAEYYFNDAGNQIETLAESVLRRYLQLQGIKIDYPEELYKGEYITDLAKELNLTDATLQNMVAMRDSIKETVVGKMLQQIKDLINNKLNIHYDVWKSEKSLYHDNAADRAKQLLNQHHLLYEQDGATWFKSTEFGDDKDRVIIKSNGEYGYFFPDILYILDKFLDRKIDHWVLYLGADHHGYQGRLEAALKAFGYGGQMDIIFVQLVRLMFNGKELRMSKRKGNFVTLEEVVDEVGIDVTRWFFLMYDANTHMDFDLNLAREQSENNPVFYVQYAYARICSLLKKIGKHEPAPIQFTNPTEEELAKLLFQLPEVLVDVSVTYHVHQLPQYAIEVARAFHKFYSVSRVIDADGQVNLSRVQLVEATKLVLENTLRLMGISTPDHM